MLPKPEPRILPSQDEFDSWTLHPVTQFVAASYAAKAKECQEQWGALFRIKIKPKELDSRRKILSAQEEVFRAFMESHYLDHLRSVDPDAWSRVDKTPHLVGAPNGRRPPGERQARGG